MVLQNIPTDYISSLPSKKPKRVATYVTDKTTGTRKPDLLLIPPLNTNIDISTLPMFDPRVHAGVVSATTQKTIPDKFVRRFNWLENSRDDLPSSVQQNMTKVGNQHACGCCWAFAVSDAVSDAFVANGKTTQNPKCSVTYALSCYPHCRDATDLSTCVGQETEQFPYSYQCNGGAIAPLLLWISQNGISNTDCENFDWCAKDSGCTTGSTDTTSLNNLIPDCKCASKPYQVYYIDTPIRKGLPEGVSSPESITEHVQFVKKWIYNYGTVVTGFFVFANLMAGDFIDSTKNPEGIYLEDVDYHSSALFGKNENAFEGGHAVCIVGWGEGPVSNTLISDKTLWTPNSDTTIVPYWLTRNSWGTSWCQGGLFKMAMYPFNKVAQFDKYVMIHTPQGTGAAGGQVLFQPGRVQTMGSTVLSRVSNYVQSMLPVNAMRENAMSLLYAPLSVSKEGDVSRVFFVLLYIVLVSMLAGFFVRYFLKRRRK